MRENFFQQRIDFHDPQNNPETSNDGQNENHQNSKFDRMGTQDLLEVASKSHYRSNSGVNQSEHGHSSQSRNDKVSEFVDCISGNFENLSDELEAIWTQSSRLKSEIVLKRLATFLDRLEMSIKEIDDLQK